jgi:hypothetical protein
MVDSSGIILTFGELGWHARSEAKGVAWDASTTPFPLVRVCHANQQGVPHGMHFLDQQTDFIAHSYCTAADNFRAEAAAVEQRLFDAGERAFLKIAARFTEFDPAHDHFADLKLDADQMIQRDTFGQ